jgi:hypothetical protein
MLNPRILVQFICLGTLDPVLFFLCWHFLFFFKRPSVIWTFNHIASMGSRSFDFHTPAQSLSTNFFVNFLRSEEPPVNTCALEQQAAMLQEACIIINAVHVYDGFTIWDLLTYVLRGQNLWHYFCARWMLFVCWHFWWHWARSTRTYYTEFRFPQRNSAGTIRICDLPLSGLVSKVRRNEVGEETN